MFSTSPKPEDSDPRRSSEPEKHGGVRQSTEYREHAGSRYLQDYSMQLIKLEKQYKKRLLSMGALPRHVLSKDIDATPRAFEMYPEEAKRHYLEDQIQHETAGEGKLKQKAGQSLREQDLLSEESERIQRPSQEANTQNWNTKLEEKALIAGKAVLVDYRTNIEHLTKALQRRQEQIQKYEKQLKMLHRDLKQARLRQADRGTGWGFFVVLCLSFSLLAYGTWPDVLKNNMPKRERERA